MNKLILFSIILILIFSPLLANASLVPCGRHSDSDPDDGIDETCPCNICHFWLLADRIINFIIWNLSIPVAVLALVIGGIILLTSGGNENRVTLGKEILWKAALGIFIVFVAWFLIDGLIKTIAKDEWSNAWNNFECKGYHFDDCTWDQ